MFLTISWVNLTYFLQPKWQHCAAGNFVSLKSNAMDQHGVGKSTRWLFSQVKTKPTKWHLRTGIADSYPLLSANTIPTRTLNLRGAFSLLATQDAMVCYVLVTQEDLCDPQFVSSMRLPRRRASCQGNSRCWLTTQVSSGMRGFKLCLRVPFIVSRNTARVAR